MKTNLSFREFAELAQPGMSNAEHERQTGLANAAVTTLSRHLGPAFRVHWDDCDMDCRSFWIHVRATGISGWKPNGPARGVPVAVRRGYAAFVREHVIPSPYVSELIRLDSPRLVYQQDGCRKWFSRYNGDTWIYKLTLYGG